MAVNFSQELVGAFSTIILLAVMSCLLPYALCALAELMILLRTGRTSVGGAEIAKVATLGALGFLYSLSSIYGAGAETVLLGVLLVLAGIPVHVGIQWCNSRASNEAVAARLEPREV